MGRKQLPKLIVDRNESKREIDFETAFATDTRGSAESSTSAVSHDDPRLGPANAAEPERLGSLPEQLPAGLPRRSNQWGQGERAIRRRLAEQIVKRYSTFAGFGGIIPVPAVNIAGITFVIMRMVKTLARLYDVPFEHNRARSIVISLFGGAVPTGLAVATASTFIYVIPGINLVGAAVSSLSAVGCTRAIGHIFVDHFERGGSLFDPQRT